MTRLVARARTGRRPPARKRRSAGRPAANDTVGRERLIEAAIELLRNKEPSAISIQDVAASAGVDPALVRYYFSNKQRLLIAAASHIAMGLQTHSAAVLGGSGSAQLRLRKRIETLIEVMERNPRFHQLLLDHVYPSKEASGRALLDRIGAQGLTLTRDFLRQGTSDGELRQTDPRFLHLAIIGICEFFVTSKPLQDVLFRERPDRASRSNRYAQFIADVLVNGLRPRGRT